MENSKIKLSRSVKKLFRRIKWIFILSAIDCSIGGLAIALDSRTFELLAFIQAIINDIVVAWIGTQICIQIMIELVNEDEEQLLLATQIKDRIRDSFGFKILSTTVAQMLLYVLYSGNSLYFLHLVTNRTDFIYTMLWLLAGNLITILPAVFIGFGMYKIWIEKNEL